MKTEDVIVTITKEMIQGYERIFGKQTCTCLKTLSVGDRFRCTVTLDKKISKGIYTFYTQTLVGYDLEGSECFRCVSDITARSQ
ncbi:hypothetical protein RCG17_11475 [Neobacillus sp. PS3-12]|uniref:hypothetical protein n=1 Tax=Neobacillus sp. PS3-12 TaxID=3070677 RepID=UPI0027DFBD42|nr:hypothetical protein [Neobacillus sp. PS3-12]WML55146.1 hypothetical protein RCG17_11475 [Neobacillus sp. PS3-12]